MSEFDEVSTWVDEWGITWHGGEDGDAPDDPGWDYIIDESGDDVICPECRELQLYYHNGEGCCINCHATFSDEEITDWAGFGWRHGRA